MTIWWVAQSLAYFLKDRAHTCVVILYSEQRLKDLGTYWTMKNGLLAKQGQIASNLRKKRAMKRTYRTTFWTYGLSCV